MSARPKNRFAWIVKNNGIIEACEYLVSRAITRLNFKKISLPQYEFVEGLGHPVRMRSNTSDQAVLTQVFRDNEFGALTGIDNVRLIIDCGAYIGLSALWFLNRYPAARIITIEPDRENYKILCKNLRSYGDRVRKLYAAVWPGKARLTVKRGDSYWATRIEEGGAPGTTKIRGVSIDDLIAESGLDMVDILKIDIEGSEEILFLNNSSSWVPKVRNIAIELHGKKCEEVFFAAMESYDYELSRAGDILILKNIIPKNISCQK